MDGEWHKLRIQALAGEVDSNGETLSLYGRFVPVEHDQLLYGPAHSGSAFMDFGTFVYNPDKGLLQWQFLPGSMFGENMPKGKHGNTPL